MSGLAAPRAAARLWAAPRRAAATAAAAAYDAPSAAAIDALLARRVWLFPDHSAGVTRVRTSTSSGAAFHVLRDDLAGDPFINGNKRRKLNALWPELEARGAVDVVAAGGAQSAHLLAVAAAAARSGRRAHLLVRGERPAVLTGNLLFAHMFAHAVEFVPRAEFADRGAMLDGYSRCLLGAAGAEGSGSEPAAAAAVVEALPEGGAVPAALLGLVALVRWLAGGAGSPLAAAPFAARGAPPPRRAALVVDAGTGATAAGLAAGAALAGLPWRVVGVALGARPGALRAAAGAQLEAFCRAYGLPAAVAAAAAARLSFQERAAPRRFGDAARGEAARCRAIAARTGILVDPVWTLAAWEAAEAAAEAEAAPGGGADVLMVHTGGHLGLCAAAQRWPAEFL